MSNFRATVYSAIDGERNYQQLRWGSKASSGLPGNGNRTIDEFAGYITGYALELLGLAAHSDCGHSKLDQMRKIAAMCVACMEQHGAPFRTIPGTIGPVFANPVEAMAARRSDDKNLGTGHTCDSCNWTNSGCLNVGKEGSPWWMCHGCITRFIQFTCERLNCVLAAPMATQFTNLDDVPVTTESIKDACERMKKAALRHMYDSQCPGDDRVLSPKPEPTCEIAPIPVSDLQQGCVGTDGPSCGCGPGLSEIADRRAASQAEEAH